MTESLQAVGAAVRTMPDVWLVDLPFERPLSLNDRPGNWQMSSRLKREWRQITAEALMAAEVPACKRVRLTLFFVPKVNRDHDEDNLVLSMKPVADAVVDAGIVPKDTAEFMERMWPVYTPKDPARVGGRVMVQVERLA